MGLIRKYQGGYFKNTGTSPSQSFNANFGKLLKRNQTELGITELSSAEPTGGATNSSIWLIEYYQSATANGYRRR